MTLRLRNTVLDTTDARGLAEFYRRLLGLVYAPGDEPPAEGLEDVRGRDWLRLRAPDGTPVLAFQQVAALAAPTWPADGVPQQLHLDCTVDSSEELASALALARSLGARLLLDRTDDPDEQLLVLADPAGHPFCVFVPA